MECVEYMNPWYKPGRPEYGPEQFRAKGRPVILGEYRVYERVQGRVWDVVTADTCVAKRSNLPSALLWVLQQPQPQGSLSIMVPLENLNA
jgi:hypothetical protein